MLFGMTTNRLITTYVLGFTLNEHDPLKYETFSINQLYLSSADCVRPKLSAEQELSQTVKVGILADDSLQHVSCCIAVSKAVMIFLKTCATTTKKLPFCVCANW